MSLARQLSRGIQKKKVSVDEVRENPKNFYIVREMDVEKLMRSMLSEGQLENVLVYEDEDPADGKKYTLLSGATRYRALKRIKNENLMNEFCDVMLKVDVYGKPKSDLIENRMIRDANLQREKSPIDMFNEIRSCEEEIKFIRSKNPDMYQGKKTRDIVGEMLGITGRTVDNRKKVFEKMSEKEVTDQEKKSKEAVKKPLTEKEIIGLFKKSEKQYEKTLLRFSEIDSGALDDSLEENVKKVLNTLYEVINTYE